MRDLMDSILDRQRRSWRQGGRPSIEELLAGCSLQHDSEAQLDLVYNEVVVREELGEHPSKEEYGQRYPHLQGELDALFEVHCAVNDRILNESSHETSERLPPDSGTPGPQVVDYELGELIGQGGMAVVYKARHRRLHRHVALKMLRPGRPPSSREAQRFETEAEAIARLQHPNIIQIFEIGQRDGLPYLALELAEQGTLAQRLQQVQFKPRAAAELAETLARAVHHAHEQHIIHRDLKPANVLFTREGTPKITDFGLAKILQEEPDAPRDATRSGEPIGTPRYMAPEQAAGRADHIGPATDVYALGTIFYECLTGQVPFLSASAVETMEKIRADEPRPPRRLQSSVPRDLETICLNCLHKEPRRRYASALDLAEDLRRFLHGEPIRARSTSAGERLWKWCRRRPTRSALGAVGILLVLASLVLAGVRTHRENQRLVQLRGEVDRLMKEGQEALLHHEEDIAQERFRRAWIKVQAEPALQDYQTGVAGWLDHSRRAANQQRWKQRNPPREYDALRDEALVLSLFLDPLRQEPELVAGQAIRAALELTLADDPAWRKEREQLVLLDADLIGLQTGAAQALARLDKVQQPSSRLFHARRAEWLDRAGREAEASRERLRAEQFPPDDISTWLLSGADHLRRRDLGRAVRDLEALLNAEPEHFTARLLLAIGFLLQKRPGEARVALTACLAQRPRFAWSYLFRGRAFVQAGDLASAAEDFERGLDANPSESAAFALLTVLGLLYSDLRQEDRAYAALKKVTEILPDEASGWGNLARMEARRGRWARAEELFAKAVALQPSRAGVYRIRSACYREHHKWAEALEDLDRGLEREPASPRLRAADQVERARVLLHLGRKAEALAATREALRDAEDSGEVWQVHAEILSRQKRYAEAAAALDRCVALGGASFEVFRDRGVAHLQWGRPLSAIDDYSRALLIRADADLLRRRGWAYLHVNSPRLAVRDFERALQLQPESLESLIGRFLALILVDGIASEGKPR
jgi:tetratricopeptide (TPR) repeat protein/tRNA A-37 threonylcarbamoyl transferase component Bud32